MGIQTAGKVDLLNNIGISHITRRISKKIPEGAATELDPANRTIIGILVTGRKNNSEYQVYVLNL